jgi:YHS domain-containing protein
MSELEAFEQRIKERLTSSEEGRRLRQLDLERRMLEFESRHHEYTAVANCLMAQVICPRMQKLAAHFTNASFPESCQGRHLCLCSLEKTDRFPANVRVELAISHDGAYATVQVEYKLQIIPVFFAFKREDQLAVAREAADPQQIAAWVDDRLVEFIDTYLQLEVMDQYQRDNQALDPVCGMWVNKSTAPARMEFQNQTYYFCLEECRQKFAAEPMRYLPPGQRTHQPSGFMQMEAERRLHDNLTNNG